MDPRAPVFPHTIAPLNGIRLDAEIAADRAASALARTHTLVALAACAALGVAAIACWAELAGRSCGGV